MKKPTSIALAFAFLLIAAGCAGSGGKTTLKRPVFKYSSGSVDAQLDTDLTGTLDPQSDDKFAHGYRFQLPAAGTLHVEASAVPEGTDMHVAIYTEGKKALAEADGGGPLDTYVNKAGPCYVVFTVPLAMWASTFKARVTLAVDDGTRPGTKK